MFYVYLIKSKKDGSTYIGYTNNLKRRFDEHNKGESKYTKLKRPWNLIYYESYKSTEDAKRRESALKKYSQAYKGLKDRLKDSLA